jgi:hypothetical protein
MGSGAETRDFLVHINGQTSSMFPYVFFVLYKCSYVDIAITTITRLHDTFLYVKYTVNNATMILCNKRHLKYVFH